MGQQTTPDFIPALTIHQPFAWAIAEGHKRIENRSRLTHYRGPIAIHAGRSRKSLASGRHEIERLGIEMPADDALPFGAIVAVGQLVGCVELAEVGDQPFAEGPYCWMLEDVEAVESVPYRGALGLFRVPSGLIRRRGRPDARTESNAVSLIGAECFRSPT